MPELPDIELYLEQRTAGQTLTNTRVRKPFLLRSFDPPISAANDRKVVVLRRIGKRIVIVTRSTDEAPRH